MFNAYSREGFHVAIVGATGAVGQELVRVLHERRFPVASIRLLASKNSEGKTVNFAGEPHPVQVLGPESFTGIDIAFFSAGASRSKEFAPIAVRSGAIVIDNSSAFRMDDDIPLLVPEVNPDALTPDAKVISVPNCSAIILLMAIGPLRKLGAISRVIVSTYQSASGGGAAMMQSLLDETAAYLQGRSLGTEGQKFPPYAFNLFSHNTPVDAEGFNEEERKLMQECRKILAMPDLRMNATCIRVPVLRAHSESVTVEFNGAAPSIDAIASTLASSPGVVLQDNRESNDFPNPRFVGGKDDVHVGRLRVDPSQPNSISMFVVGDQLLKGAALNAVQIAEECLRRGFIGYNSQSRQEAVQSHHG